MSAIQPKDWEFAGGLNVHRASDAVHSAEPLIDPKSPLTIAGWILDLRFLYPSMKSKQKSRITRKHAFKI